MNARFAVLALPILFASACSRQETAVETPPAPAARDWTAFSEAFLASRFKADPYMAVQSGRHEFDGQMPDWSRAALEADAAGLRSQLAELQHFNAASLTDAQRFE